VSSTYHCFIPLSPSTEREHQVELLGDLEYLHDGDDDDDDDNNDDDDDDDDGDDDDDNVRVYPLSTGIPSRSQPGWGVPRAW
jgi:hypothetical protein